MKLFDSHCHLDDRSYHRDLDDVIRRMKQAGCEAAMIAGVDLESSRKAVALSEQYTGLFASVGVHPHDAKHCSEIVIEALTELSRHPRVRAWGELGLDFNRMYSPKKDQEHWFARQLDTANALALPIILHERDSNGRLLEILKTRWYPGQKGVVHCFSGTRKELFQYLDLGLCIGITGILTIQKRGRNLRNLVPLMPLDRILIETDAPYLTPAPEKNRYRRNEPAFVKSILLRLADLLDEDPERLSGRLWENTRRLYDISNPL